MLILSQSQTPEARISQKSPVAVQFLKQDKHNKNHIIKSLNELNMEEDLEIKVRKNMSTVRS